MATPAQRTNTWTLDEWYAQSVAGTTGGYSGAGALFAWGYFADWAGGTNDRINRSSPTQIGTATSWGTIETGNPYTNFLGGSELSPTLGLKQDGTLWWWGENKSGASGTSLAPSTRRSAPTQVGTDTTWRNITQSKGTLLATKTDGTLWTWGQGTKGCLGDNATSDRSSPIQVGTDTTWNRTILAAANNVLATKTDGTLWGWGGNSYSGPLGLNNKDKYSSPTQIPGTWGTDEYSVGGYNYFTGAINSAGKLYTWGANNDGNLGHNNKTKYSSPVQVGTNTTWSKIQTSGSYHMGGIKTDGTLWQWGKGGSGALGQNNQTDYSSPKQVGTETTWSMIAGGYQSSLGVKTDGTLWAWGDNDQGTLGHNNETDYSSPKQVGSGTTWNRVLSAGLQVYATKTDGTSWSWGNNEQGRLGHNQAEAQLGALSSPTQIPGTMWSTLNVIHQGGLGLKVE